MRLALLIAGVALLAAASAGAATSRQALTIYAKAKQVQFVDHSDDRSRGVDQNPFGADTKALLPLTKEMEKGKGPYPGDNALYTFRLYGDPRLTNLVGTAVYSCTFNFQHHALCEASFELNGGTMFASGPADFNGSNFTLAVLSGTAKYLGARGQVSSAPAAAKDAHRLRFVFR
jgi:hypothetical protein